MLIRCCFNVVCLLAGIVDFRACFLKTLDNDVQTMEARSWGQTGSILMSITPNKNSAELHVTSASSFHSNRVKRLQCTFVLVLSMDFEITRVKCNYNTVYPPVPIINELYNWIVLQLFETTSDTAQNEIFFFVFHYFILRCITCLLWDREIVRLLTCFFA